MSAATAKKAMKSYIDAHKRLSALKAEPASKELETASKKAARTGKIDIASADSAVARAKVLKEFISVFNAVGAGRGIDTMEREEILGGVLQALRTSRGKRKRPRKNLGNKRRVLIFACFEN